MVQAEQQIRAVQRIPVAARDASADAKHPSAGCSRRHIAMA
jgi:hypothetical protein